MGFFGAICNITQYRVGCMSFCIGVGGVVVDGSLKLEGGQVVVMSQLQCLFSNAKTSTGPVAVTTSQQRVPIVDQPVNSPLQVTYLRTVLDKAFCLLDRVGGFL